jgi:GT2 family glycosyltransferase
MKNYDLDLKLNMKLAVLLTVHNRREITLSCLQALFAATLPKNVEMEVYLTDDGSKDGTAQAVSDAYPGVIVIHGDGSLFWNGGMRLAFGEALKKGYDYYLWLNDDTKLLVHALESMLYTSKLLQDRQVKPAIVVGTTVDAVTREATYAGRNSHSRLRPFYFDLVVAEKEPVECDTLNGNFVLIPSEVAKRVGNLDPIFTHGIGDFDYGLRARAAGCSVWVNPGAIGYCKWNPDKQVQSSKLSERIKGVLHPKKYPLKVWWVFCSRYGGPLKLIHWMRPYLRALFPNLFGDQTL